MVRSRSLFCSQTIEFFVFSHHQDHLIGLALEIAVRQHHQVPGQRVLDPHGPGPHASVEITLPQSLAHEPVEYRDLENCIVWIDRQEIQKKRRSGTERRWSLAFLLEL